VRDIRGGAAALLLVLAFGACRRSERHARSDGRDAEAADDAMRASAERARETARVPGLAFAALTRDSARLGGVGSADLRTGAAVDGGTVLEAASIAKLVIATCVMQLVEARRVALDADAGAYVAFALRHPRSSVPVTLRRLLAHRAGLRDRPLALAARREENALGPFLERYVRAGDAFLATAPDESTTYSNAGAALAALVVERVSGEDFESYATRHVLAPLRMTSSSWRASAGAATPYALQDGRFVPLAQASHAVYPVVDLRSSAHDLARFGRMILRRGELDGARVVSAESVDAMLDVIADDQALAWQLRTLGGGRAVAGHEGEDAGASTALFLDRAAGTGAVILANGDAFASGDAARAAALQALLEELLGPRTPR
jgi:CubicO group peptidase (beta-lactamase class C family)